MSPALGWGLGVGALILTPCVVAAVLVAGKRELRWCRFEYAVLRGPDFVIRGRRFAREDPERIDTVAAQILTEWLELHPLGDPADYHCVVHLEGYGTGEAWARAS